MEYRYKTSGTCSKEIVFEVEDGVIKSCKFLGGCPGNLSAISKLLEGADAERAAEILSGNTCGPRSTSCADQLSKAIRENL